MNAAGARDARAVNGRRCVLIVLVVVSAAAAASGAAGQRGGGATAPGTVEVLRSVSAAPVEIAGVYEDPVAYERLQSGQYLVFDRRSQSVWGIDRDFTGTWRLVGIGQERGRIYQPLAFASEPGGNFVVLDQAGGAERLQVFTVGGAPLGGFRFNPTDSRVVIVGGMVLNGSGWLQFTGRTILVSRLSEGTLFTEYTLAGATSRTFGRLRPTGHEDDPVVHRALNTGIPLIDPTGGFYYVFQAGVPMFRKYDAGGNLVFERHVEGRQLDETIAALPSKWAKRKGKAGEEIPLVVPVIRCAAVDPSGNLWVSLTAPYTYVYDSNGDKIRTVQFRAAGIVSPTSMFFASRSRLLVTPGLYEFDPRR